MSDTRTGRPGLRIFRRADAPDMHATNMALHTQFDQVALAALPELTSAGGFSTRVLHGDPDGPAGGGLSLVLVEAGPNYPLPRHSHSVDCLYYVLSGEVRLGSQVVPVGDGFFVPADAPYGYSAGPDGVALLEFRGTSTFDSRGRETALGWTRVLEAVRENRDRWS